MKTFSQFQDPTKDIKLNLAEASILKPDYVIWMDTVKSSKYKDTDEIFEPPSLVDSKIDRFLKDEEIKLEAKKITKLRSSLMLEYEDGVRPLTMDI